MEVHNMKTGWIHTTENNTDVRFAPKTLVSEILISENGPDLMTALNQMLLEKCYPVGAVYLSTVSTSPASVIGGTWERIENKALVAWRHTGIRRPSVIQCTGRTGVSVCIRMETDQLMLTE